MLRFKWSKMTI